MNMKKTGFVMKAYITFSEPNLAVNNGLNFIPAR